jgi:hypothetical protein
MKLQASLSISTFMYLEAICIFSWSVLFVSHSLSKLKVNWLQWSFVFHLWSAIFQVGNLYVGHLCELSAQPQERRGRQGTAANHCLAAVPCPSLSSCGLAKSFVTQSVIKIKIPNKTFLTGPSFVVWFREVYIGFSKAFTWILDSPRYDFDNIGCSLDNLEDYVSCVSFTFVNIESLLE